MHKWALFTTIAVIALSGCSKDEAADAPLLNENAARIAAQDDSAISLFATHAFDVPAPIARIAFTPNDVASWLGVIGMLTTDGHFYTSFVEGDNVNAISLDRHIDIIGLNHPKAPGMFLTLLEGGELRAYIESDDTGGFTALSISAGAPNIVKLCDSAPLAGDKSPAYVITDSGDIKSYMVDSQDGNFTITEAPIAPKATSGPDPIELCAASTRDVALITQGGDAPLTALINQTFKDPNAPDYIDYGNKAGLSAIKKAGAYAQRTAHAGAKESHLDTVFAVYSAESRARLYNFTIEQGLSISGLSRARAIAATSSPFGGSGFNDGIIALADAEDDRIVILSRSYLIDQVKAAEEPQTSE